MSCVLVLYFQSTRSNKTIFCYMTQKFSCDYLSRDRKLKNKIKWNQVILALIMLFYTCFLLFMLSVTQRDFPEGFADEVLRLFNTQTGVCYNQENQSGILEDVDTTLHTQPITLICLQEYSLGWLILHKTTVWACMNIHCQIVYCVKPRVLASTVTAPDFCASV